MGDSVGQEALTTCLVSSQGCSLWLSTDSHAWLREAHQLAAGIML